MVKLLFASSTALTSWMKKQIVSLWSGWRWLDHVGADRMAVRAKDLGLHLDAEEARGELDLLAQKNLLLLEIALGDGKGSLEARVEDELPHCLVNGMLGVNHRLLHLEVDPVAGRWNRHFASSSSGRNLDDDAV